jgi:hypothetical protein
VQIAIANADERTLRTECQRLGVDVNTRSSETTMRKRLRAYTQNRMLYMRWLVLAEMLFGPHHALDKTTLDRLVDDLNIHLYKRLVKGELISRPGALCLLSDPGNKQLFAITGKQNARVLTTQVFPQEGSKAAASTGSCTVLWAARIAFPDVNEVLTAWEANKEGK